MSAPIIAGVALLAFALSAHFTRRLWSAPSIFYVLDTPNERSLHTRPVPRTGGLAVVTSAVLVAAVVAIFSDAWRDMIWFAAGTVLVAAVSFMDDRRGVHPRYRLLAHAAGAGLLLAAGWFPEDLKVLYQFAPWAANLLVLLFIVWMVNLYNFMDGMDGFAGGMAVIGFGTFAVFGWAADAYLFTAVNLAICFSAAGFLVFNFPPARIFLGDIGSSTLGFLAAGLSLWGSRDGIFPLWAALLVFSPFIVDSTVTLTRRAIRREKIWQAHKTHYYQRMVQLGWGHRKTVLFEYALMVLCSASALWSVTKPHTIQLVMLISWGVAYVILMAAVEGLERRKKTNAGTFQ